MCSGTLNIVQETRTRVSLTEQIGQVDDKFCVDDDLVGDTSDAV